MKRLVVTTIAMLMINSAYARGPEPGGRPGGEGGGPGGNAIVAADGTVLITSAVIDTAAETATTTVTAVTSSGVKVWTATIAGHAHFELSGANLLYVTSATAADGTVSSTINAISTATGTAAWSRTLAGRAGELLPFNGGTYAIVVTPAATSGGTATRSLVAVSSSGSVLWTVAL